MSDNEKDLFGSSSDEEEEKQQQQPAAPSEGERPAGGSDDGDGGGDEPGPGPGSRGASPAPVARQYGDEDLFGEEEEEEDDRRPSRLTVPYWEHAQFFSEQPDPESLRLVRVTNVLNVSTKPFNPATFEREEEHYVDAEGRERVNLRHLNTVRWRVRQNSDGTLTRESNARFVRWSDGSLQLFVGDEALDVAEIEDTKQHHYLYVRQKHYMQGQARLVRKMQFRPATLNSKLHQQLRSLVGARHQRRERVKETITLVDPKQATAAQAQALASQERAREKLARSQARERTKYARAAFGGSGGGGYSRGPAPVPRFSAGFLEAGEGDDYDDEGGEWDEDAARRDLSRGRRGYDADQEAEAERRLAAAKRGAPPHGGAASKRPRVSRYDDDEDEELSDIDDEAPGAVGADDEMADFIVDDDEEEDERVQRGRAGGGKGSGGGGGGGGGGAKPARRGVVISDEDDD